MLQIMLLVMFAILSVSPLKVDAHGIGQTIEIQSGQYIVDIGYDSIEVNPLAGEPTRFDFGLFTKLENDVADFDDIEVRFSDENKNLTFLADIKRADFGPTGLIYAFPQKGSYEAKIAFKKDAKEIANAVFSLEVDSAYESESNQGWQSFSNGAILGATVIAVFMIGYDVIAKRLEKRRTRGK